MKKKPAVYARLGKKIQSGIRKSKDEETLNLHTAIRGLRKHKALTGVELCRRAGDLDPKTLAAVEAGRIKNPSIKTLLSLSRGLGVTVGELFKKAEVDLERNISVGTQKGTFQMEFPKKGIKIVSFTPFIRDFFCGKLILSGKSRMDQTTLKHPMPFYLSALIGRFEIQIEERQINLKEGENIFFNGILKHSFYNPLHRESVLLLVTAPSFF